NRHVIAHDVQTNCIVERSGRFLSGVNYALKWYCLRLGNTPGKEAVGFMQEPQHSIFRQLLTVLLINLVIFLAFPIAIFLVQIAALTLTPIPTITGVFTTLPPGAQLPSEVECAKRVHRSSLEPRPDNDAANHRV